MSKLKKKKPVTCISQWVLSESKHGGSVEEQRKLASVLQLVQVYSGTRTVEQKNNKNDKNDKNNKTKTKKEDEMDGIVGKILQNLDELFVLHKQEDVDKTVRTWISAWILDDTFNSSSIQLLAVAISSFYRKRPEIVPLFQELEQCLKSIKQKKGFSSWPVKLHTLLGIWIQSEFIVLQHSSSSNSEMNELVASLMYM